jgi:hypothetical protein
MTGDDRTTAAVTIQVDAADAYLGAVALEITAGHGNVELDVFVIKDWGVHSCCEWLVAGCGVAGRLIAVSVN